MRAVPFVLIIVFLSGCIGVSSTPMMPHETETIAAAQTIIFRPTEKEPTQEPSRVISPSETNTVEPTSQVSELCIPSEEDYCIEKGHFLLGRPISSSENDKVEATYRYGSTQNGLREPHHGVEFPNILGTPVLAAADGLVVFAGSDKDSLLSPWPDFYGNAVVIKHVVDGEDLFTLYGHLSKVDAEKDQFVKQGQKIGEVGATGAAIGNHLHFEVRYGENDYASTRNPELWLFPKDGTGTLAVSVIGNYGTPVKVNLNIQRVLPDGTWQSFTQPESYDFKEKFPVSSDDVYRENIALGDLPAGNYRLTFVMLGELHERFIKVETDKLTLVDFDIH